jgi:Flp pilus assembly pilin Flp
MMEATGMWERVMVVYVRLLLVLQGLGRRLAAGQAGQSMVEYAIVAALIAVVAMAAVQALGGGIAEVFQRILGRIQGIGG